MVGSQLVVSRWHSAEETGHYSVDWLQDGAVVAHSDGDIAAQIRIVDVRGVSNARLSPWRRGDETHTFPNQVTSRPGPWEARIHFPAAPSISVAFRNDPKPRRSPDLAREPNLPIRWLAATPSQPIAQLATTRPNTFVAEVPITPPLIRAITRSASALEALLAFVDGNRQEGFGGVKYSDDQRLTTDERERQHRRVLGQVEREVDAREAARRRRAPALRAKLIASIARYGGPWRSDEVPGPKSTL